jgi:D-lyxose ketol-isomerase
MEQSMRRSSVNEIMAAADDLIRSYGFILPPFANWSPNAFRSRKHIAQKIITARCG